MKAYIEKNDERICNNEIHDSLNPSISVIVTAYNRRKYLLEALKSAIYQTLDRNMYEIIVIKNFEDDVIDEFMRQNSIKNIISSGIEGYYPFLALENANGEILVFLDDDDIINKNKLQIVYDTFQDKNIGYMHNNYNVLIGDNIIHDNLINAPHYKTVRIKNESKLDKLYFLEKILAYQNNSCISIRKTVLEIGKEYLKKQVANIDRFLYLTAVLSEFDLYIDERTLTTYRIHENQTSALNDQDINNLITRKLDFIKKSIPAFENMCNMANGTIFEGYARTRLMNLELAYNFWSFTKTYDYSINKYSIFIKNKDFSEIPRLVIYNMPKRIRRTIISLVYKIN
jgi:glycosyltransferase involved in cell wall biosynthesis